MALEISKIITDWVPFRSKVIDFGCGDGSLLKDLINTKNICGYGVEIDHQMIDKCIEKGISVIEKDIDKGIQDFELSNFDIAIMASSIQCLKNPNIDVISSGTFSDVNTSLSSEQFFISGEEDLLVNVTNAISGTLTNQMSDHGFIIEYSGSYTKDSKSYFVKRFASRNTTNTAIRPKLIIKFNDAIQDNHQNFEFDITKKYMPLGDGFPCMFSPLHLIE